MKGLNSGVPGHTPGADRAVAGLRAHAAQARENVRQKLQVAMRKIETEIEENDGIYPGGRLTQAEVCRRASIDKTTLQRETHKQTTLLEVNFWLKRLKKTAASESKVVRKLVTDRIELWKDAYHSIAQNYSLAELELLSKNEEIEKLKIKILELEEQNKNLLLKLSSKFVLPFR